MMRPMRSPKRHDRVKGEPIHPEFRAFILGVRDRMQKTDDNCTMVIFGPTGSGKSTLAFHIGNVYNDGAGVDPDLVTFDEESTADAFQVAVNRPGTFLMLDEGDVNKRESMTKYNRMLLKLLRTVRSKNWFTVFNNPSANVLDKDLILDDLVNYFVFIYAKQARFLLFTKRSLQKFFERYNTLRAETIRKYGKNYALLDSYFEEYGGSEWSAYLEKKDARINQNVESFFEEFGSKKKTWTVLEAAEKLDVHYSTIYDYLKKVDDEEFLRGAKNGVGTWKLDEDRIRYLKEFMTSRGELSEPFSPSEPNETNVITTTRADNTAEEPAVVGGGS